LSGHGEFSVNHQWSVGGRLGYLTSPGTLVFLTGGYPPCIRHRRRPNGIGKVESYAILIDRGLGPIQIAAGVVALKSALDAAGKPTIAAMGKYGLHALRHACASLWIEQGHNPKQIQILMGHSSIKVTFYT